MHEHGREERQKITEGIGKETARNESPLPNKRVTAALLYKERQDVQSDQGIRDQRNSSAGGIIITDWEHEISLLFLCLDLSQLHVTVSLAFFKERDLGINIYRAT
jgi:hypothetical protein